MSILTRAAKFCTCCNFCKYEAFIGDWPARIQTSSFIGPYNLHYLLFSGIGALLFHYPHCFLSQSQTSFGIGKGPPFIGEGPLIDGGRRAGLESFIIDKANINVLEIRRYGTCLDGCITLQTRKAQVSGRVWKKLKR